MTQKPTSFIPHNGSEDCPCPIGAKVDLMFRDYPEMTTDCPEREDWGWIGAYDDILGWRVAE